MGRALEVNFDKADFDIARDYVKSQAGDMLGIPFEVREPLLLNTKSQTTYSVFLTAGRNQTNEFIVAVNADGVTMNGAPSTWIAVLEVQTSILHLIPSKALIAYIRMAASNGNQFQGMRIETNATGAAGEWMLVHLNHGWAEANKIVVRTINLVEKGGESFLSFRGLKLATKEQFAHLHVHSFYSLLDGVADPKDLVAQAQLAGQPGIALTDHGNLCGTFKLYKACKEIGMKGMYGVEAYVVDDVTKKYMDPKGSARRFEHHQTLIAMNQEGWANLCELMSIASRDHFYYIPRIDHNMLFKYNAGIICLTGCFKGMLSHYLQHHDPTVTADEPWKCYNPDWARTVLREYKRHFGDRLYGECQNIPFPRYMDALPRVMTMLDEEGVPKLVTNDVHYAVPYDAILQRLLTRISANRADELGGDGLEKTGPYYVKTISEMQHQSFSPDMFSRTCEVMERCNLNFDHKGYLFPAYDIKADADWNAFRKHHAQEMNTEEAEHQGNLI